MRSAKWNLIQSIAHLKSFTRERSWNKISAKHGCRQSRWGFWQPSVWPTAATLVAAAFILVAEATTRSSLGPRLAYYLARPYWGFGFATEASRVFVDYRFRNLNLSRIEAGVNARNMASIRVLQKLGFHLILSGEGDGNAWHRFERRNPHRRS